MNLCCIQMCKNSNLDLIWQIIKRHTIHAVRRRYIGKRRARRVHLLNFLDLVSCDVSDRLVFCKSICQFYRHLEKEIYNFTCRIEIY